MSKKPSPKKPHADFINADVVTRVRMATPLARQLVTLGACDVSSACHPDQMALPYHIEALIGHDGPALGDDQSDRLWESQHAAYALGIAVGLLLRPDAFAALTGGAA